MGLFSLFTKSTSELNAVNGKCCNLTKWLNKADDAYNNAFKSKSMQGLEKYLTKACYQKIAERLLTSDSVYSGLDRYRHTTWSPVQNDTYIKRVRYDQIKMSMGIYAKVGDDYDEVWTLVDLDDNMRVSSIKRKECLDGYNS